MERDITVCIKHSSRFEKRRAMLQQLLQSIRVHHGSKLRVLIADDGGMVDKEAIWGAELVALPAGSGLSAGRNALVAAVHTPFLAMLDDDVLFHTSTRLEVLHRALVENEKLVLAAGCYVDARFSREDCFNLNFVTDARGAVVRAQPAPRLTHGCQPVHAAHNFFVARVSALRRFPWDIRQKVMEHETFFYQLFVNWQQVVACAGVHVIHNTTRDDQYRERSFRLQERRFVQYHCKNFPEIARFETPYLLWRCDTRSYCSPAWHAQFPYDGRECQAMQWTAHDDRSVVPRPLITPSTGVGQHSDHVSGHARDEELELIISTPTAPLDAIKVHVPLLVLIFTERANVARREWQRATWLSFQWHRGYLDHKLVPWRHVYVMSRSAAADEEAHLDQVVGDTVTLGNSTEGYENLVYKTMEAMRWALKAVSFTVMLKVDDDSIVHIGRLWTWLFIELPKTDSRAPPVSRLYAGRVFRGSQVIRSNFTRASLWRPDWFPSSFKKWAVDIEVFAEEEYPPYCGGGGYVLGNVAAARIIREYDSHYRTGKIIPVEDAFVGVLARAQGIGAKDLLTFQEPPRGLLQTRELFIDQLLVHRVLEPYKAFRWLMLSSNCHAGSLACASQRNRTRGLSYQGMLPTSPDAMDGNNAPGDRFSFDMDWISGTIPKADADARTGSIPKYERPADEQMRDTAPWRSVRNHGKKNKNARRSRRHGRNRARLHKGQRDSR